MHSSESRSISRAALLLLAISLIRWAAPDAGAPSLEAGRDVLAELTESTRAASDDAERRARPLGVGDRIDPNRADAAELDRLPGVGPATARAIVSARDTGTVFRRADDLVVVRGVGPALVERLRTLIDVSDPPRGRAARALPRPRAGSRPIRRAGPVPPEGLPIDINRASSEVLLRLPGVGPALAARIVEARRERRFASIDELTRVPGIGPATVERLRGRITVGRSR